eukprot:g720.t1
MQSILAAFEAPTKPPLDNDVPTREEEIHRMESTEAEIGITRKNSFLASYEKRESSAKNKIESTRSAASKHDIDGDETEFMEETYYAGTHIDILLRNLKVKSITKGLTDALARERLEKYGPNELEKSSRPGICMLFLLQLANLIIILLVVAACASLGVAASSDRRAEGITYVEGIAIFIIVLINAIIGAYTENSAAGALDALASLSQPNSRVLRNGEAVEIPSRELVPGDIVLLETGDIVPADVRLLSSEDLKVNEMLLTGEPEDVPKKAVQEDCQLIAQWKALDGQSSSYEDGKHKQEDNIQVSLSPYSEPVDDAMGNVSDLSLGENKGEIINTTSLSSSSSSSSSSGQSKKDDPMRTNNETHHGGGHGGSDSLTPRTMAFSSCTVTNGRAQALIVSTGMSTRVGKIAALLSAVDKDDKTPKPHDDDNESKDDGDDELSDSDAMEKGISKCISPFVCCQDGVCVSLRSSDNSALEKEGKRGGSSSCSGGGCGGGCLPKAGNQTPLQVSLQSLGVKLGIFAILICVIVFVVGVGIEAKDLANPDQPSWLYMIVIAVTLAVAAIPEGIPLCVTISLSYGCSQMVKQNVLVRRIAAVETLGCASVICTDKTGTLTEGKMTMVKMYASNNRYSISGKGFIPRGKITLENANKQKLKSSSIHQEKKEEEQKNQQLTLPGVLPTLATGLLCCNTTILFKTDDNNNNEDTNKNKKRKKFGMLKKASTTKGDNIDCHDRSSSGHGEEGIELISSTPANEVGGQWMPNGNSSEVPIVVTGQKVGLYVERLQTVYPRVFEVPFASSRKM